MNRGLETHCLEESHTSCELILKCPMRCSQIPKIFSKSKANLVLATLLWNQSKYVIDVLCIFLCDTILQINENVTERNFRKNESMPN